MDPLSEVNMKLDKIMEKLGIPIGAQDFERMSPDGQNAAMEGEFNANKEKLMGANGR